MRQFKDVRERQGETVLCIAPCLRIFLHLFNHFNQTDHSLIWYAKPIIKFDNCTPAECDDMAAYQEEFSVFHGADVVTMFLHVNSHENDTRKGGGLENVV